ncbi:MAG TPA: winged helix-turn-helix domain-containing protein [Terriglobia bacterium]|nr:winged helix-turn-helix domain-containing protein [Terriglobia bacterium]
MSKGELKLKLQGQPIQLLSALLERPGELVTRDELRQRLWPSDTFVDFEHSLNTAMRKLRQALGDEAETPRFIETLPKRGYRFIGESLMDEPAIALVHGDAGGREKAEVGSAPPPIAVIPKKAAKQKWGRTSAPRVKLAVSALVAAAAVLWSLRVSRRTFPTEFVATPLTAYAGGEWEPDLSPDGKMVAFSWDEGDRWGPTSVYVKMVSGNENAIRVAPAESHCPAWSPDGNTIAFVYATGPQPGIYAVSPLGGAMKMLLGPGPHTPVSGTLPRSCNLSWSSDGKWLLFSGVPPAAPQASRAIYKLSVQDGTVSRMTNPGTGEFGDFYPHFSPDDKLIAFSRWTSADVADAFVIPAVGGEPRRITHDNALLAGLAWTADGKELVISSTRVGAIGSALWRVRLADSAIGQVAVPSPFAWQPSLSRRGSRLAYSTGNAGSDISEVSLQSNAPERSVYSSTFPDAVGCYSPDGSKVVFVSGRSGKAALWVAERDGSALMELVSGTAMGSPRWSPDGKWIAYDAEPSANASLFILAPTGGAPRRLTDGKAKDIVPTWSRDSHWLYFSSNRTGE